MKKFAVTMFIILSAQAALAEDFAPSELPNLPGFSIPENYVRKILATAAEGEQLTVEQLAQKFILDSRELMTEVTTCDLENYSAAKGIPEEQLSQSVEERIKDYLEQRKTFSFEVLFAVAYQLGVQHALRSDNTFVKDIGPTFLKQRK